MPTKPLHIIGSQDPRCAQLSKALVELGWNVTTSVDGNWNEKLINKDLVGVIRSTGISDDNPELKKSNALEVPIYSFAQFVGHLCADKQRIVVAGSHGLRKIIALVIHILSQYNREFDYSISYKNNEVLPEIKLTNAPYILIQGSEVTDPVSHKPEFMSYQHHTGVLSGIDIKKSALQIRESDYGNLFKNFADATPKGGVLLYNELDPIVKSFFHDKRTDVLQIPFVTPKYEYKNGVAVIKNDSHKQVTVALTGSRNMLYINAAKELVRKLGVTSDNFYDALTTYAPKQKLA
ncbi:MAG: hypothetical protein HC811_01740 [Flammeovirgaceae bacterium]|nr:hypothetical protein [Flammeovirgaceae bacterium]